MEGVCPLWAAGNLALSNLGFAGRARWSLSPEVPTGEAFSASARASAVWSLWDS